jgi:ferredoxin-NADP reductase
MPIYKVILKSKQEIAAGTMAFHFEKPEGFVYKAGQFADFTLINPAETDARGQHTSVFSGERALRRLSYVCDPDARYRIQAGVKNNGAWHGTHV